MSLGRVVTVVAGLAAAGAVGGGVASWWQLSGEAPIVDVQSGGFSGDQMASIEGIIDAYMKANRGTAQSSPSGAAGPRSFSAEDTARIEGIMRNYLLTKPEIMRDVFAALEAQEERDREDQLKTFISTNADQFYGGTDGLVLGNPNGDVTLVEFFDYNCGYCKRALGDLMALIEADPNVKVVMKEFPILSPGSIEAARVSIAAAKQGRYFDFHVNLLSAAGQANGAKALRVAEELGLDMLRLQEDIKSADVQTEIDVTQQMAAAIGIRGTPAYVVGTELIPGAVGLENLQARIKKIRDAACISC